MNFYDVRKYGAYENFMLQRRTQSPYQGTNNVYPLGARRYSARHWRYREDTGQVDIFYVNRQARDKFEKGEHEARSTTWLEKRHLATVYPDNTAEIISTQGFGDNTLLSVVFGAHICQSAKHGGTILRNRKGELHPLFKGQRFKMDTFECVTPYEVFQRRVNRKLATQAMKEYDEFINLSGILIDPMDGKGLWETAQYLMSLKQTVDTGGRYAVVHNAFPYRKLDETFFELIGKKHYVDAAMYFAMSHDVVNARWILGQEEFSSRIHDERVARFKDAIKRRMRGQITKDVYYKHNVFNMS